METTKRMTILLMAAVLATSPIQAAEQQKARLSETRTASCLVKVTCDPAILPLNLDTVNSLLRSSAVGGKAARQVLDVSPGQVQDLFTITYVQELTSQAAPRSSRGRSSVFEDGGMDEYEYAMMMEMEGQYGVEMGRSRPARPTRSSRSRGSSGPTQRTPRTPRTIATSAIPSDARTYLFSLHIQLPEEVRPAAKEFMNALVDNLRQALTDAHHASKQELQIKLDFAQSQRDHAQSQLAKAIGQTESTSPTPAINPANEAVYAQLEEIVDLSNLEPQTSFADVIEMLENSVSPPLQIQPNWKDLLEKAEVEPTTPAGMDPLNGVKVRKALEILLAGVSSEFAELNYVVDEGVILIATEDTLPDMMETRVYEIPALAYSAGAARELAKAIQENIDPESWYDLADIGEATISIYLGRKLAILQTPENHQKIQQFLKSMTKDSPVGIPPEAPTDMLMSEKYDLLREKQDLEREIARLKARPPAIDEQIKRTTQDIREKINDDPIGNELNHILELQRQQLEAVKRLVDDGRSSAVELANAEEKLARTRIEIAQRRELLSRSAGGDQLVKFSNELATLTVDLAEKEAMLKVINDQLGQTEQQLMVATISDLQVTRIRQATQILEDADRRVNELNSRMADLQSPTVSVIGGD